MVHSVLVGLAVTIWCAFAAASRRGRTRARTGGLYRGTLGSEGIDRNNLHHNTGHQHGLGLDGPHGHQGFGSTPPD
jgi:hypothetical protein